MLQFRKSILLCLIICIYPSISPAQELFVFKSSDHSPSNSWTSWENIARPWFFSEFGMPFERMTIRVNNIPYGGSYDREINTVRQPETWQWIEDLTTGTYDWFARFEYFDGHVWRWSNVFQGSSFYVDRTAPNGLSASSGTFPTATSASSAHWTNRSDLTFSWSTPTDAGSGIHHYELSVNGGAWQPVSSGYSPSLSTGVHSFAFRAIDNVGLVSPVYTRYARVDYVSPDCAVSEKFGRASSSPEPPWTNWPLRFMFFSSDAGSGVKANFVSVDEGSFQGTILPEVTLNVSDGPHTFDFKAMDEAENESTVKRFYARVDREIPTAEITNPPADTLIKSDSLILTWTGEDQVSGISYYIVELDGGSNINVGLQTSDTIRGLTEGAHQLIVAPVDHAANYVTEAFDFYVDLTEPVITSEHPDLQIPGDDNCNIIIADYTTDMVASDDHSATVTLTQDPEPGTSVHGKETEVTLSATDDAGNIASVAFTIDITDTIKPVISFSEAMEVVLNETCQYTLPDYTVREDLIVSDDCSTFNIVQLPAPGTEINDTTEVTLEVTDEYGNSSEWILTVNVNDETDPVIVCVDDQVITLDDGETEYKVSGDEFDPGAYQDNCSEVALLNDLNQSATLKDEVLQIGTTTITWTATDASGNAGTCSFNVTVSSGVGFTSNGAETLSVYPNPTTGKIIVESGSVIEAIDVTGIGGKTIMQIRDTSSRNEVDLSRLAPGFYFLKINSGGIVSARMVIKE